ncbi:hypothetical protein PIB30_030179 [Stylosanthes scabra]|uniref:XS domain-containing protein n=1 Tax=Stylosanthes scabra TaxID=79078 RepID=A0ABU6SBS7_9FABA|nr:hypothetical protein [Stylosanthes scabra]
MSTATKNMKLKMKAEPQSPPNITDIAEEQPLMCPLIGVLANIPLQWNNNKGCFVGPSGVVLKEQLSKRGGFRPLKVEVLCCGQRGHSGFALVFFDLLEQATMFEKSFQNGFGKREWNNALVCPSNKFLYGWIAGEDDYRFEGIVGHHLRKITGLNLKGVFDDMKEEEEAAAAAAVSNPKRKLHSSEGDEFSFLIDDLLKQKDEVVQRYHQDMGEAHDSAQKHLENIISQREDVRVLLKQEIEMRNTALIENASLEQRKADDNLVLLLEKHKKQKEELHRGILDFQKGIEKKHRLELEMEQMKGALKVMKHMGDADVDGDDEEMVAEIESIQEGLKEKEEEYKYKYNRLEAMSRCIKSSDGEHDCKPFIHVTNRMCFEDKEVNKCLEDPTWNPFFQC